ncbi:MAG: hypothetical protein CFE45_08700, partial [Burkholderiales bacterium PBB5]
RSDGGRLSSDQALSLGRRMETAPAGNRRFQFFIWTQSQMQPLVPHQLMVCGAYQRHRRSVVFDAFHSIVLSPEVLGSLTDADGPLTRSLSQAWVAGRCQPTAVALPQLDGAAQPAAQRLQQELGFAELLVHGVARPQRPNEIESLFILGGPPAAEGSAQRSNCLDLVLPHLHRIWQRVVITEHELLRPADLAAQRLRQVTPDTPGGRGVTARERQILQWVRDGNSNQQVAQALNISPLTVKNHVQKILRKLGASNRAQAVARAMSMGLLQPGEGEQTPST